jgi:hypothetical protein
MAVEDELLVALPGQIAQGAGNFPVKAATRVFVLDVENTPLGGLLVLIILHRTRNLTSLRIRRHLKTTQFKGCQPFGVGYCPNAPMCPSYVQAAVCGPNEPKTQLHNAESAPRDANSGNLEPCESHQAR